MNRSVFLKNLGMSLSGTILLPNSLLRQSGKDILFEGNDPVISFTPWGQKVIYDRYTYMDMQKGEWLKKGFNWQQVEQKASELNSKIANGEIEFSKGPVKIVSGLWQLDVDGQQNILLINCDSGLCLIDPGMVSNQKKIIQQINELGYSESDIKHVLLTHCHVDHSHSASYWQKKEQSFIFINWEKIQFIWGMKLLDGI